MAISLLFALAAAAYTESTHLKQCHVILELLICHTEGPVIFNPDWNHTNMPDATPVSSLHEGFSPSKLKRFRGIPDYCQP